MNDQLIILKTNIGRINEKRTHDFKNYFLTKAESTKELIELKKSNSIDLELNEDGVMINIRNKSEHIDLHTQFGALIDVVLEALNDIYVESIELVQLDYFNTFEVDKTVINPSASLSNELDIEGVVGKGYKFGITRNDLKGDLTVEPDYYLYNNSGVQNITVSYKSAYPIAGDLSTSIKDFIRGSDENYLYYLNVVKNLYKQKS